MAKLVENAPREFSSVYPGKSIMETLCLGSIDYRISRSYSLGRFNDSEFIRSSTMVFVCNASASLIRSFNHSNAIL